jgi:hypothetical protein
LQIKTKIVSNHTADSKPVNQEVNGNKILIKLCIHKRYGRIFCSRTKSSNVDEDKDENSAAEDDDDEAEDDDDVDSDSDSDSDSESDKVPMLLTLLLPSSSVMLKANVMNIFTVKIYECS